MSYIVGVDIGGTFTDCTVFDTDAGSFTTAKAPTTPDNPAQGFFDAVGVAAAAAGRSLEEFLSQTRILVNGTTVGTNAIVTWRGAKVGLLATKGHGEAILIMRGGGRTKGLSVDEMMYVPGTQKPPRIVPRQSIEEITERVDCRGDVVVALDEAAAEASIRRLLEQGIQALAICLLWSFANPSHEQALKRIAQKLAPNLFISCSHEVSPALGEYGRTVATVMNAYIGPLMKRYVDEAGRRARGLGFTSELLYAQCVGGCVPASDAAAVPLYTVDSGPVSGVAASSTLGPRMGYPNIITTDMGGTTFDVGIIYQGSALTRNQTVLNQYEMNLPMVDVVSIGAGGGSIAFIDPGSGMMRVGPRSAGADPGPICYARGGTEPTVTDANVVMGIINPDYFLGGQQRLDPQAAREGIAGLAAALGLSLEKTAAGICRIVDTRMAGEIRRLTLFRGYDPRDFVVFAFGGGGPTHAATYAAELGVKQVIVPLRNTAAAWSALGTFAGGVVHLYDGNEYLREPMDPALLNRTFHQLEEKARRQLAAEGFAPSQIVLERWIGMRYVAQVSYLEIPVAPGEIDGRGIDGLLEQYETVYTQRYGEGAGYREAGIEVLKQRVRAVGLLPSVELTQQPRSTRRSLKPALKGLRQVYWWENESFEPTPVYDGDRLACGQKVKGPAIIELPYTTVPVRPQQSAAIDTYGNLALNLG